jgi:hypothetical protein
MARCALFLWFCYEEGDGNNVVTFLDGGGVIKKAMVEGNFFSFIYLNFFFVVLLI